MNILNYLSGWKDVNRGKKKERQENNFPSLLSFPVSSLVADEIEKEKKKTEIKAWEKKWRKKNDETETRGWWSKLTFLWIAMDIQSIDTKKSFWIRRFTKEKHIT